MKYLLLLLLLLLLSGCVTFVPSEYDKVDDKWSKPYIEITERCRVVTNKIGLGISCSL